MRYTYRLDNLGCASCANKMESAIKKIYGVESAKITFMTSKLIIETDESKIDSIELEVDKSIKKIENKVKLRRV